MDIKEYIEKIVDNGDIESMCELSYMLQDTLLDVKDVNEKKYDDYSMKLYRMAYGETLNKEMADKIIENMKPYGMRWTIEDIRKMQNDYGINDIRTIDVYVVMNSAYNDYKDIFGEDIENYIKFTIDFIEDEDAKDGKVFKYFIIIPKGE